MCGREDVPVCIGGGGDVPLCGVCVCRGGRGIETRMFLCGGGGGGGGGGRVRGDDPPRCVLFGAVCVCVCVWGGGD